MRKISRILVVSFVLVLLSVAAFAQNVVTGKVTDTKDGTPVSGVTVTVRGTRTAVQTAADGTFKINAPAGATLIFTSVGFATQQATVGSGAVEVGLTQANQQLNEVVVVGYGTTRKKDLTGSVTTVSAKDFQKGVITTPEQLISGKVPGVAITSNGGQPGSGSIIRIRGGNSLKASNDPLIVVDGVVLDPGGINGAGNALSLLNSNDIETFTVLKDASATAIYGSRASGGVILITTKKGRAGGLKINFVTALSVSTIRKKVDVYSGDQIRAMVQSFPASAERTQALAQMGTANTDWQDEVYHTAVSTDNNLSLTGGIKKLPYRLSFGYSYMNGIIRTDHLQKTSLALALSPTFFDNHLKVDLNLKGIAQKTRFADQGVIGGSVQFDPTQPVHSNSPRYGGYYEWVDATGTLLLNRPNNPVGLLEQTYDNQKPTRSIGNIQLDYKFHFLPALRANLNVGYDIAKSTGTKFISDSAASNYSKTAGVVGGLTSYGKQTKNSHFLDFYLNYAKELKSIKSRIDATVGYAYNYYQSKVYNYRSYNAKGDTIAGTKAPTYPFSKEDNATIGYFARAIYTYKDKYVLTATFRRDGSSRFAKNNRWNNFPSVAFAWRMIDEPFLKKSKLFSDLKFRAGYGKTGQQEGIANYTYFYGFSQSSANAAYGFGNNYLQSYSPSAFNPNLKWETTTGYNAALDFGFLNNRITGSVDFYLKKTKDLLNEVPQPAGTNFSAFVLANVGDLENKGVEFNLGATLIKKKDLNLDINFNATYNKSTITNLTVIPNDPNYIGIQHDIPDGVNNGILIDAVGYSANTLYLYHQIYDPATGQPIQGLYEDVNRDGIINEKDRYKGKPTTPDLFFGFTTNATYKNWSAGFVLRANFNNYVYNNVASSKGVRNQILGSYVLGNATTSFSETGFTSNQGFSDYYVENASFLKMDNLNVGYNFGKLYKGKVNLRLSAIVQNVFTITKYKGLDPEVYKGIDRNLYPRPRIFTIGANLDF
jgi:iron complex outermembrane receptor protein